MKTTGTAKFSAARIARNLFVGDHVALDLLNTVSLVDRRRVDALDSDRAVVDWLTDAGHPVKTAVLKALPPGALLAATRTLREIVRTVLVQRKCDAHPDLRPLNAFLARGSSHLRLVFHEDGSLGAQRRWNAETPEQLLAPLAEAAADLLAQSSLELVRECEDAGCVLWFYDRTKSHHRRWCSSKTCGNRNKVAAFRLRQNDAGGA